MVEHNGGYLVLKPGESFLSTDVPYANIATLKPREPTRVDSRKYWHDRCIKYQTILPFNIKTREGYNDFEVRGKRLVFDLRQRISDDEFHSKLMNLPNTDSYIKHSLASVPNVRAARKFIDAPIEELRDTYLLAAKGNDFTSAVKLSLILPNTKSHTPALWLLYWDHTPMSHYNCTITRDAYWITFYILEETDAGLVIQRVFSPENRHVVCLWRKGDTYSLVYSMQMTVLAKLTAKLDEYLESHRTEVPEGTFYSDKNVTTATVQASSVAVDEDTPEDTPMRSIYSTEVGMESLPNHGPYYFPSDFLQLTPTVFTADDEYRSFLINISLFPNARQIPIKVQHFTIVMKRGDELYSMAFGEGPSGNYVLKSPDPFLKTVSKMETIQHKALGEFAPLGDLAPKLNHLLQQYTDGGYVRFKNAPPGFFANHEGHRLKSKKYNFFTNTCLSGFESVFPVPADKLRTLERLCLYTATRRGGRRTKRNLKRNLKRKKSSGTTTLK